MIPVSDGAADLVACSPWRLESAWSGVRLPVDQASSLPAACYADDTFFEQEQDRVFAGGWVAVAFLDEVGSPGQAITRTVAGQSVIVTRNKANELRAFRNSCRHRGTELIENDCLVDGVIRCPYHRWGYDLDGTLVATPKFDQVPVQDFDRADYGLHPVAVDSFAGMLFVSLDTNVAPLVDGFGDLETRLDGYRLQDWRLRDTADFEINANWKLISENFQEYYHLTWVHPDLSKVSRVDDHYRYQGPGLYCGQTTTPVSSDERDDWTVMAPPSYLSDTDRSSGRFIALFPNVLLSILPNHVFIMILEPLGPGLTLERTGFLLPATFPNSDGNTSTVSAEAFEATRSFWVAVNDEDIGIVERGQRGLSRGGYRPGRLSPRFEEPLHRFYNMLADAFVHGRAEHRLPNGDPNDGADRYGSGVNPLPYVADMSVPVAHVPEAP